MGNQWAGDGTNIPDRKLSPKSPKSDKGLIARLIGKRKKKGSKS